MNTPAQKMFLVTLFLAMLSMRCFSLEFHAVRGSTIGKAKAKLRKSPPQTEVVRRSRTLKSGKKPKVDTLRAKVESEDKDWDDLGGYVYVYFDGDEMDISYDLEDLPEKCEDDQCYIAIHEGEDCDDLEDKYHKSGKRVWDEDDTGFTSNKNGRAAGMFFGLESGYDAGDNVCKTLVIYGPEDESSDDIDVIGCGLLIPEDEDDDYCD